MSLAHRLLKLTAVATTVSMFLVFVMGSLVTNTGSGHGCNNTWPLCNGKFIPEFTVAAAIEWSHRAVTGIAGLLIVALSVGTVLLYRRRRETWVLVPMMIVFLVAQAVLGAIAAGTHESPAVLSLHFGISLVSFASIVLTTAFLFEVDGRDAVRDRPVRPLLGWSVAGLLAFTYVVTYSGAYVVHKGAQLACVDWPLCGRSLLSPTSWLVVTQMLHRGAATALVAVIAVVWGVARRSRSERPDLYRAATAAGVIVVMQALAGGLVIATHLDLLTKLLHAGLVSLLFATLCYMAYHLVPRRVCLPRARGTAAASVRPRAVAASAK